MINKLIEIRNLDKTYKDELIIKNLNLDIRENEILVILGYSGIGKSTLLNLLAKLDNNYKGEIIYNDEIFKNKIVPLPVVFQNFDQLLPWYNLQKNILLPFNKSDKLLDKFNKIINILELNDDLKKYPNQISGGMKQKVSIARALLSESKIIFFDEPFSSLDLLMRRKLQDLILKIKDKFNQTIFFITHDIEEAIYLADRIVIMKDNKTQIKKDLSNFRYKRYTKEFDCQVNKVIEILK